MNHLSEFMTDKQVAAWLNCSRTTVWEMSGRGLLSQPYRFGRCTRWRRDEIERALAEARS
jgi:predicted DNA-binding transcriptional regulator AlpA